jgi:hypothetical protein
VIKIGQACFLCVVGIDEQIVEGVCLKIEDDSHVIVRVDEDEARCHVSRVFEDRVTAERALPAAVEEQKLRLLWVLTELSASRPEGVTEDEIFDRCAELWVFWMGDDEWAVYQASIPLPEPRGTLS